MDSFEPTPTIELVRKMMAKKTLAEIEQKFVQLFDNMVAANNRIAWLEVQHDQIPFDAIVTLRREGVDDVWPDWEENQVVLDRIDAWIKKEMGV